MATEVTPLLLDSRLHQPAGNGAYEPASNISAWKRRCQTLPDLHLLTREEACPTAILDASVSQSYGFALAVILSLRRDYADQIASPLVDWEHWTQQHAAVAQVAVLDQRISSIWQDFLNECTEYEQLEQLLWSSFFFDERELVSVRMVDLLAEKNAPKEILRDSALMRCIELYWKHGPHTNHLWWDTMTPRVSHLFTLTSHLATFFLLAHYLLFPLTSFTASAAGPREIILALLCLGNMLRRTWRSVTFGLILISFLLSFSLSIPSTMHALDLPFYLLLLSFVLLFIQLHYPASPSPIFLVSPSIGLPLAVLLSRGLHHVILPVTGFFLSSLIVIGVLLSLSMKNPVEHDLLSLVAEASPMITRQFLLFLGFCTLLAVFGALVLVGPSVAARRNSTELWDQYSESVGTEARRVFVKATSQDMRLYFYPPPMNIVYPFLWLLRSLFGRRTVIFWIEKWLWRICPGIPNALVNILFWILSPRGFLSYYRRS